MTHTLPRDTPESQYVESAGLRDLAAALESLGSVHSLMLVRHGFVVAERWWAPAAPEVASDVWSLSKSFTSTAVGLVITEGRLALTDRVVDLLPEEVPAEVPERLARLTVRHLLTMTTGHATESLPDDERPTEPRWAQRILAQPLDFEPGTHFQYNSGATYLLSAIVQSVTGMPLLEYLRPRLFEPLGIHNPTWLRSPQGVDAGGWGLSIRTEDIAKFGQLYLQRGQWDGESLIPSDWIAEATRRQVSNGDPAQADDWTQGYGYQFWRCRNGAYRGDGKLGQFCVVMPDRDAVLALTGDVEDMSTELNLVWEHLLPALAH
jgi:CubicO group peptidase (beta-lactamase class C family)